MRELGERMTGRLETKTARRRVAMVALAALAVGCSSRPARQASALSARVAGDNLKWVRQDVVSIGERWQATLVYDRARKNSLLFGGRNTRDDGYSVTTLVGATMIWDGSAWSDPHPAHEPSARASAAIVYDDAHAAALLYGGFDDQTKPGLSDTWSWNGTDWTQLTPAHVPAPTSGAGVLAYDAVRQRVVLVSAYSAGAAQVWEWSGSDWIDVTASDGSGPVDVFAAVTAGPAGGILALAAANGGTSTLWSWDGHTWTEPSPDGPASVYELAYDSARNVVVGLAGDDCFHGYEWDGHAWSAPLSFTCDNGRDDNATPVNNAGYAVAYDEARTALIELGGANCSSVTWSRTGGQTSPWTKVAAGAPWPQIAWANEAEAQRITYDAKRSRLVLVDTFQHDGTIWEFDGTRWSVPGYSPPGNVLQQYGVVNDDAHGRTLVVGGTQSGGLDTKGNSTSADVPLSETCQWDGASVSCASVLPEPYGRIRPGLAFDGAGGHVVLFGGASCGADVTSNWPPYSCTASDNATYAWDGAAWTIVDDGKGTAPAARNLHAMAWDGARKRLVVFGGIVDGLPATGAPFGDTWEWDGAHWTELQPAHSPPARFGATLVYDAHRGVSVLFGGTTFDAKYNPVDFDDGVWEWDGRDWLARTPVDSPGVFPNPSMAWDASRQLVVLYGAPGRVKPALTENPVGAGGLWELVANPGDSGLCSSDGECNSGHCVDHVCCDTACGGNDPNDCQACSVAAGAATDGTCSPFAKATVCRASAGACDVAEVCDGVSGACPADARLPSTTVCRASTGACDAAETCGGGVDCPPDQLNPKGAICRASAGACDVAETCDGVSAACAPDALAAAGTLCAAATGCISEAICSGSSAACPAAAPVDDGTACSGGECMSGQCVAPGSTAPTDMGSPPDSGATLSKPAPGKADGCGCTIGGATSDAHGGGFVLAALLLAWPLARRRRVCLHR